MARARKCYTICNTTYGYIAQPIYCNSIKEAEEMSSTWWAYRIFDAVTHKLIKRGFGKDFRC